MRAQLAFSPVVIAVKPLPGTSVAVLVAVRDLVDVWVTVAVRVNVLVRVLVWVTVLVLAGPNAKHTSVGMLRLTRSHKPS